jgi:hypothetical protein
MVIKYRHLIERKASIKFVRYRLMLWRIQILFFLQALSAIKIKTEAIRHYIELHRRKNISFN